MTLLIAIIYGIIQGITEFLPVSSSGHLALMPFFMKIKDPGVVFDLSMHMGTLFAVILYFYKEVKSLLAGSVAVVIRREKNPFVLNILLSTVMTFILVFILKDFAQSFGRTPLFIAINLALFGILMFLADWLAPQDNTIAMKCDFHFKRAALIGLSQALAIFPGVSRSGATLTVSRALGMKRDEASRYSFLLSVPIILAGFVYKLPEFFSTEIAFDLTSCLIGGSVSFVVGIASIHFFLQFISRIGLKYFAIYRVLLAAVLFYQLL